MSELKLCKYCGMELSEDASHGLRECHLYAVNRIAELEKDLSNKEIEYTDLWDDALALQSRIAELEEERRWIPVSERLPKENAPVLVLTVLGGMFVDFIHGKSVVTGNPDFYELDVEDVTHWMPLPQLPEVQE